NYRQRVLEGLSKSSGDWTDVKARVRSGKVIDASWSSARLSDGTRISIGQDITERKALEDKFLQAQKMEAIGRLAGGIAHDFNNLLTIILGVTQLVLRRLVPDNPLRHDVGEIEKAALRGAALTNQLLVFSRKQIIQPRVLNLNTVLSNLEELLRRLMGENIALVTNLDHDLFDVRADPGQLDQILMNLAVNALDAMAGEGTLTIETTNIIVDDNHNPDRGEIPHGAYGKISVSDSGSGMTQEIQDQIFEPFFTTKEPGKGTGLGLSTVYAIVQQSRGYITVDSAPGRGATFNIYLPKAEKKIEVASTAAAELPRGSETILLVEDDPMVRVIVRDMLSVHGYNVLEASSAPDAISLFNKNGTDIRLVLTDVGIPGKGGRGLVETLAPMLGGTKVLYMSGHPLTDIRTNRSVPIVETQYIEKPLTIPTLTRKVRELLDG
ncbi:MAG TPA: ATP-binding protein, partial [Blastocatellia bacterium]